MFRMTVENHFSAAHVICDYPGPCRQLHGHNYRVEVHLEGEELDALGMLIDYVEVKRALEQVLDPLDHQFLNELPEFSAMQPTSEQIARLIYGRLKDALLTTDDLRRRVRLADVTVYESERQGVGYGE